MGEEVEERGAGKGKGGGRAYVQMSSQHSVLVLDSSAVGQRRDLTCLFYHRLSASCVFEGRLSW